MTNALTIAMVSFKIILPGTHSQKSVRQYNLLYRGRIESTCQNLCVTIVMVSFKVILPGADSDKCSLFCICIVNCTSALTFENVCQKSLPPPGSQTVSHSQKSSFYAVCRTFARALTFSECALQA